MIPLERNRGPYFYSLVAFICRKHSDLEKYQQEIKERINPNETLIYLKEAVE